MQLICWKMFSFRKRFQFFLFLSKTKIPGLDLNKEIKIKWFQESFKSIYLPAICTPKNVSLVTRSGV